MTWSIFRRKYFDFEVEVYLSGRHPYLSDNSLDFPSKKVGVQVIARDWREAEVKGTMKAMRENDCWAAVATSISRIGNPLLQTTRPQR